MKASKRASKKSKPAGSLLHNRSDLVFSSEELLQKAIVGLLKRMPDHTGVQPLQGSQELGKDVIFYAKGGLGEPILCACVIKNKQITGKVSTSGGARTILFQAEQALDSVHVDDRGNDVHVETVYVITPFDLPPPTITSIKGRLKEKEGRVKFIGGSALFDLFKRHWPDFIADEAAFVDQHIKETKAKIVGESRLRKLAFQYTSGSVSEKLERVYVIQGFHRELNGFGLGQIFTSLPNPQLLGGKISQSLITGIQTSLQSFDEGLSYLHDWGFCPPTFSSGELNQSLREFTSDLTESWETQLVAERKHDARTRRIDWEASTIGAVAIADSKRFENRLKELNVQRQRLLSVIEQRLKNLQELVTNKITGVRSLSNEKFLKACQLNDCAKSAPEGLFVSEAVELRVEYPKDILNRWQHSIFIVGAPGYGKTSFCRWRALQDAEHLTTGKSATIPVYIALHRLAKEPLGSFEATFLEGKGQSALIGALGEDAQSNVRLYLDGLDEVGSTDQRRAIINLARSGADRSPTVQIVLTSRDYIHDRSLDWLPKVNLSPFNDAQIQEFIDKWYGRGSVLSASFRRQLATLPTIHGLIRTPLLATLTSIVFMQTKRLPESRSRLYDIFIELLSGGWDSVKGVQRESKFGLTVKLVVLTSLARMLHENRQREFSVDDLRVATRIAFPQARERDCSKLRDEFLIDGIVNLTGSMMQFSHLSFQEFLAARDLMGSPYADRASTALGLFLGGDNWWRDVLKFYLGLSRSPTDVCDWLSRGIMHRRNRNLEVSTTSAHELLGSFAESFPSFPLEELARRVRGPLDYDLTLSYLRRAQAKRKV